LVSVHHASGRLLSPVFSRRLTEGGDDNDNAALVAQAFHHQRSFYLVVSAYPLANAHMSRQSYWSQKTVSDYSIRTLTGQYPALSACLSEKSYSSKSR
jgi:hypothetical protein